MALEPYSRSSSATPKAGCLPSIAMCIPTVYCILEVMKMSVRTVLSIATFILIVVILVVSRHELMRAWQLMSEVNLWVLALLIPIILLNYLAAGEMIFSYLRGKKQIKHVSMLTQMRMSLEMNFVNHALPSGGASGISYMTWRLGHYGVSPSRAIMAQAVRLAVGFAAFSVLLVISVLIVTIDTGVNRSIILVSSTLVGLMMGVTIVGIYFIKDLRRVRKASTWLTGVINALVRKVTFGRKRRILRDGVVERFLVDIHEDFLELNRDRRVLIRPFIWAIIFTCTDIAMFFVAFWALGTIVNPAPILIAYGLATIAGFAVITPGGSGAYEALMVGFLVIAGVAQGTAIAGVVLTRVLVLLVIIVIGYIFYQLALMRYGKRERPSIQRQ